MNLSHQRYRAREGTVTSSPEGDSPGTSLTRLQFPGGDPLGGTAAPLRHLPPDALPMSALSADEPDGAHAAREPTEQAWSSPLPPSLAFMEEPWRARSAAPLLRLLIPGLAMPAGISAQAQSRFPQRTPAERRRHNRQRSIAPFRAPLLGRITAVPRVLGIDDFALRRSRSYATVLIDAETGRRASILPGRTADVAEAWLRDHPGVEIVCRDGSGAYGEAARRAARSGPASDRWQSGPRPTSSTYATASAWSPTTAAR